MIMGVKKFLISMAYSINNPLTLNPPELMSDNFTTSNGF